MAFNLGNLLGSAGAGAATGFGLGGPVGAAVGGGAGALLGWLGGKGKKSKGGGLGGTKEKFGRINTMSHGQRHFLRDLYNGGGLESSPLYQQGNSYLSNLLNGSPEAYAAFEQPYLQNFEQSIVPGIAERFAGAGTGAGASSSSALYNSLAQAGRGLQTDLAGLRAGLQTQAAPLALQQAQLPFAQRLAGLNAQPYQPTYKPAQPGFFDQAASGLVGGFNDVLGKSLGQWGQNFLGNTFGNGMNSGSSGFPTGGLTNLG